MSAPVPPSGKRSVVDKSPGRVLYEQWCGSSETDRARYFNSMNPADKAAWERLAVAVDRSVGSARQMGYQEGCRDMEQRYVG